MALGTLVQEIEARCNITSNFSKTRALPATCTNPPGRDRFGPEIWGTVLSHEWGIVALGNRLPARVDSITIACRARAVALLPAAPGGFKPSINNVPGTGCSWQLFACFNSWSWNSGMASFETHSPRTSTHFAVKMASVKSCGDVSFPMFRRFFWSRICLPS